MKLKHNSQSGFTIVELMIAAAVFSIVLILISMGLIQIGRLFYKGITSSNTQEIARSITDDITQAIQLSGDTIHPTHATDGTDVALGNGGGTRGFCLGTRRYSYAPAVKLTDTNHVLLVDRYTSTCNGSTPVQNMSSPLPGSRELMSVNMRLANLQVQDRGNNLYAVTVRVIYGDDDLLCTPSVAGSCTSTATLSNPQLYTDLACKTIRAGSQFCAASELTTTVQKRIE